MASCLCGASRREAEDMGGGEAWQCGSRHPRPRGCQEMFRWQPSEGIVAKGETGAQVCGETSCLARVPHLPNALYARSVVAIA